MLYYIKLYYIYMWVIKLYMYAVLKKWILLKYFEMFQLRKSTVPSPSLFGMIYDVSMFLWIRTLLL